MIENRQPIKQQIQRIDGNSNSTIVLRNVQRYHEGNYTCTVRNSLGSDQIVYQVYVHVPPGPPELGISGATATSVTLEWALESTFRSHSPVQFASADVSFAFAAIDTGRTPIKGLLLSFRRELGDWEEISIDRRANSHTLEDLQCGTTYQFTLAAFNKIGSGSASKTQYARTKGKKPISPEVFHFIRTNITSVMLDLSAWQDGGCPIQYFTIEFRRFDADAANANEWIVVSSNVPPKSRFSIPDLEPATVYNLRITAHNNAGSTIAAYIFETLNEKGDLGRSDFNLPNDRGMNGNPNNGNSVTVQRNIDLDSQIIILLIGSVLGVAVAFVCACFCFRSSRFTSRFL